MTTDENSDESTEGEIMPEEDPVDLHAQEQLNVLALISNYTDRPDLFLAEVEKHDPGFVKKMNESARTHSEELRKGRFRFAKIQAYFTLSIAGIAAISLLAITGYGIYNGTLEMWQIIALAIFYAITQGGDHGFGKIIGACADAIVKLRKDKE